MLLYLLIGLKVQGCRWNGKVIREKISGTLEKESTQLILRGIHVTSDISLHSIFLHKNIVEEMKGKEDELCEPTE
jgi:hypothetical protein